MDVEEVAPAAEMRLKPVPKLAMASMVLFEAPPTEKVYYEKELQTVESSFQTDDPEDEAPAETAVVEEEPVVEPEPVPEVPDVRVMDEIEKEIILQSWQFQDFFDRSSKLVERALNSKSDSLVDYTMADEGRKEVNTGRGIKSVCTFSDDRLTKNRSVTDLSWSPRHPELCLASYTKPASSLADQPDGLLLLWNTHVPTRPEFQFHAQSDITTSAFSPFHPTLLLGGTYSGQILIWDTRTKHTPVLKTPLSSNGHTHPVSAMHLVGTQNAHQLVTTSTDGLVCTWTLDMLANPIEVLELAHNPLDATNLRVTNEIAVTCFGFPAGETGTFWVGTEEGAVYQANRYDRAGAKAGINPMESYTGHDAVITGLDFHPLNVQSPHDFSDLFLTSSADWTVRLWRARSPTKQATSTTPSHRVIQSLHVFEEANDFVWDVKWSPVHPAVFGCVDGSGRFSVYDLNMDVEVPSASVMLEDGKAGNKLAWEAAGQIVGVGVSDGSVQVYDVGELGKPRAGQEEFVAFQRTLGEFSGSHGGASRY
ncbi:WD40 repeat-like protein [Rhizoclosmatium globosum]|uniref:WD40 repeat-like protein n=1 Tax=Rhizoclosmatium globosum TaxID=329046 RepID=A0A1Y2BCC1_9FUNG|nr:WD40 repeat-like protein [Rhizoclosmatium globosum]|eukprot:ORY32404.1 WD40 repeat-like protein [Rhizoclosmatium globosum]